MALTHRGYHSLTDTYVYWKAVEYDPIGASYPGSPPFGELSGIAVILTPGAPPDVSSGVPFTDEFGARGVLNILSHELVPADRPDMGSNFFATYANGEPIRFTDDLGVSGTMLITSHEPIPTDRPNMTSGFAI